jgi:methyltransferase-like protein
LAHDAELLGQTLLNFYASASTSFLELYATPPRFATTVAARPVASPLARLQAKAGDHVTTFRHETVVLGDFERLLLTRLDGKTDVPSLLKAVETAITDGELEFEVDGISVQAHPNWKELTKQAVDQQLLHFAKSALLSAT